ncbi:hypothetical protein [Vallitalea okinawensis]|uniref:hypothetical protein n=1 Tax=Vallitalea okinawensis TaxID=2078660 RepID=UPI000CFDDD58|nr:hypothetical protein [Vallitalea okinawensis]
MQSYYERILRDSEKRVEYLLYSQILDTDSQDYGAVVISNRYVEPKSTLNAVAEGIALYLNEKSQYYHQLKLEESIKRGLNYARRMQRENGLFDLIDCNFYSAPDTAFCIKGLIPVYRLLVKANALQEVRELLYQIIVDGAKGMLEGGFHTPNHRWAIASMLLTVYNMTGEDSFKIEAKKYLNEGIDCNAYGEYAERSSGGYNVINNGALITISEELNDPQYLEYVKRNLQMMLAYIEPDGSVFTNNSTRQDKGRVVYPSNYFYHYLYMGSKLGIGEFLKMAAFIFKGILDRGDMAPSCLSYLMLNEDLRHVELGEKEELASYRRYFDESGVVRVRNKDTSYSLVADSNDFLFFQQGNIRVAFKLSASYFATRAFKAMELKDTGDGFKMNYSSNGWYYRPFDEAPPTTDWWQMDHDKRELIRSKDLNIQIDVKEVAGGIDLVIKADGCDRLPYSLEMAVINGDTVENNGFACQAKSEQYVIAKSGDVLIKNGIQSISIGPAFGAHQFVEGKNDAALRDRNAFYLYFTDFTESERIIHIRGFKGLKVGI